MCEEYVTQIEGAYRVAGTRVSLDSVVYSHIREESPESIQRSFPTLTLAQIHGAIAYYLEHETEIDRYLKEGKREFEKLKPASREAHPEWYEKLERNRREIVDFPTDKTRFQADVNLNENIVTGVRRVQEIDFQTAHDAGLHGRSDSQVLHLAASDKRILVTQDQRTMPKHFKDFMQLRNSLGVLIVSQKSNIEPTIDELILIWKAFDSWEHVGLILYP
ncbi:MAG: DUF5615 family PIN-like protein [Pyrinomonadaceae bacterium]